MSPDQEGDRVTLEKELLRNRLRLEETHDLFDDRSLSGIATSQICLALFVDVEPIVIGSVELPAFVAAFSHLEGAMGAISISVSSLSANLSQKSCESLGKLLRSHTLWNIELNVHVVFSPTYIILPNNIKVKLSTTD
jgi:hypothetical protein